MFKCNRSRRCRGNACGSFADRLHSYPLAAGRLAKSGSILGAVAKAHDATPSQIALAWVLKRSPVMLPIPGTSKVAHLEENVAAVNIQLSDEEFDALDREGQTEYQQS